MATYTILCYIQGILDWGLFYPSSFSFSLSAYANAECAWYPDTRPTTGWCMFLETSLISWKCKNQTTIFENTLWSWVPLCPLQVAKWFGYDNFFCELGVFLVLLHSMRTMQAPCRLQTIQFYTCKLRILRWIVASFVSLSSLKLYIF